MVVENVCKYIEQGICCVCMPVEDCIEACDVDEGLALCFVDLSVCFGDSKHTGEELMFTTSRDTVGIRTE